MSSVPSGVKLPKLFVPVFDSNIVNWHFFWELFTVPAHDRTGLSLPEKLTYLKQAVKDGSAKHVVEGLLPLVISMKRLLTVCASDMTDFICYIRPVSKQLPMCHCGRTVVV